MSFQPEVQMSSGVLTVAEPVTKLPPGPPRAAWLSLARALACRWWWRRPQAVPWFVSTSLVL